MPGAYWHNFQLDLLEAAAISTAQPTQDFLFDWNYNANSKCKNNPVDISHAYGGSTNCHKLTNHRTAQAFPGISEPPVAFSDQIHSGNFPHLLAALDSGDPYNYQQPGQVIAELAAWGSFKQSAYYSTQTSALTVPVVKAPRAHKGWADMQRSVNRHLPSALRSSKHATHAAWRSLARATRVRI